MATEATGILNRRFIQTFLSQIMVSSVYCLLIPTLPIYLSRMGTTEVEIGILIGALSVSSLVMRPLMGRVLVTVPEGACMAAGALLFAISSAAYLIAVPFWPFLAVRIVQGVAGASFWTAAATLVSRTTPPHRLGESLSYYFLGYNIAFAAAPTLGVLLIDTFDFNVLFLGCTALSILSLVIILRLGRGESGPRERPSGARAPFLCRRALRPAVSTFMSSMIWGSLMAFFPLYAMKHGMGNPGLFFGTVAIFLITGRALGGRILDRYPREKVILPCLAVYIVAMTILLCSRTFPQFIVAGAVWGMGHAFLYPSLMAYTLDRSAPMRGPALGTFLALDDLGGGLGPMIMGVVLRLTNYSVMFAALIFVGLANFAYFYALSKGTKRRGSEP
jgi:MFS family permease